MSKNASFLLVLIILLSSWVIAAMPVSGASAAENSWVELAPMHEARAWLGVASVNGKIYAIGGSTASGFAPATFPYGDINLGHFVGTNEEYDPTSDTWSYKTSMPTPRMAFAIVEFQGKIYCIGGRSISGDLSGGYTAINEVYDPITDTWGSKAAMPSANGWIKAKVIDNKIYILNSLPRTSSSTYYVYDPATDTWNSSVPSPMEGKILLEHIPNGYPTTGILSPKLVYTFSDYKPQVKAYSPEKDNWQNGAISPIGRTGFGIALANDTFYLVGGYTYQPWGPFAPAATNEKYIPFGYGTPDPSYLLETIPPKIIVLSPISQTYKESSVSLVFSIDKPVTWTRYSLDGQQNITLSGDTNLTDISNGLHNITVYAQDTYGNIGSSEAISFTIAKPLPEPFPIVPVAAISTIAAVVAAGLLFIIRKHRTKAAQS